MVVSKNGRVANGPAVCGDISHFLVFRNTRRLRRSPMRLEHHIIPRALDRGSQTSA